MKEKRGYALDPGFMVSLIRPTFRLKKPRPRRPQRSVELLLEAPDMFTQNSNTKLARVLKGQIVRIGVSLSSEAMRAK